MGLIDVKRKEQEQLNQGLLSIDGTIKLFDPDFNLLPTKYMLPVIHKLIYRNSAQQCSVSLKSFSIHRSEASRIQLVLISVQKTRTESLDASRKF
jgi:hypothetical protein